MSSLRASPAFTLVVLVTLGVFGFVGVILLQPELITHVLGHETRGHISQHFRQRHHRVHDLTFSLLMATAGLGMLVQLRRPSNNVAGQVMALIPWIALGLTFVAARHWIPFAPAPVLAGLTLVATILHPRRRDFLGSFSVSRVNPVMLVLLVIAAVPLLTLTVANIALQRTATNDHAALGHYGFMAAFGFTVIGVGLLASLRPDGWRLTAWVVGFLPALLGLASLVYPDADSSLGLGWALAAIAWGIGFVAAAEITRNTRGSTSFRSRGVASIE